MIDFKTFSKSLLAEGERVLKEDILPYVDKQTELFKDKWLVNRIRLGVTGLSGSGKTTFITSLIYHLLRDAALSVSFEPDFPKDGKRFRYEENIACFKKNVPEWPPSTLDKSEICLKINDGRNDLYLEIVDYPGEWLLDLPLLEQSFWEWSQTVKEYLSCTGNRLPDWAVSAKKLADKGCSDNENVLEIADQYRLWLHDLKNKGFEYLQPGRFVMPDTKSDIYTLVNFFPWVWDDEQKNENALFKKLEERYNRYKIEKVEPFYRHFKNLNKQIVLVDCLRSLQKGVTAWNDLKFTLGELLKNFSYGRRNGFVARLLNSFKIDQVLFVATKADYVSYEEKRIEALTGILKSAVAEAAEKTFLQKADVAYRSVAAVSVQKINKSDDAACYYFPNGKQGVELPEMLTQARINEFKEKCSEFDGIPPLSPRRMNENGDLPNIEMFNVIKFILGEN